MSETVIHFGKLRTESKADVKKLMYRAMGQTVKKTNFLG